jgi:hypothetical protein
MIAHNNGDYSNVVDLSDVHAEIIIERHYAIVNSPLGYLKKSLF